MEAAINFTTCGALHNPEVTSSISRWFVGIPFSPLFFIFCKEFPLCPLYWPP